MLTFAGDGTPHKMHNPVCRRLLLWTAAPWRLRQALRVQATPRAEEVAPGGIGSTLAFTEDSRLGPEPMLWSSPGAGRPGAVARNSRVRAPDRGRGSGWCNGTDCYVCKDAGGLHNMGVKSWYRAAGKCGAQQPGALLAARASEKDQK